MMKKLERRMIVNFVMMWICVCMGCYFGHFFIQTLGVIGACVSVLYSWKVGLEYERITDSNIN